MGGRFELDKAAYRKAMTKSSEGSGADFSLKDLFPEYFVKTSKAPRLIQQVARDVLDEFCDEQEAIYHTASLPKVHLFFRKLPKSAAKMRAENAARQIKITLKEIIKDQTKGNKEKEMAFVQKGFDRKGHDKSGGSSDKAWKVSEGLAHALKKGFNQDPITLKDLNLLCERMVQQIHFTKENEHMAPEFFEIGKQKQKFLPMWESAKEQIIGSTPICVSVSRKKSPALIMRYDIVNLLATYIRTLFFLKDGGKGIIFLPLDSTIFAHKKPAELYCLILERLHPKVQKMLCIEICGLSKDELSSQARESIERMAKSVGSIAIENDVLFPFYHDLGSIRPIALGFNISHSHNSGSEPYFLMQQFIDFCDGKGLDVYVKNVKKQDDVKFLIEKNVPFIIGPVIDAAQSKCIDTRPHSPVS